MHKLVIAVIYTVILFIIVSLIILYKNRECFSDTENREVYNLFNNAQKNNGTFNDFKEALTGKDIVFSENINDNFNGGNNRANVTFEQYVQLLKKYNKGDLDIHFIDQIRTNI